jgi:hypothetical protein
LCPPPPLLTPHSLHPPTCCRLGRVGAPCVGPRGAPLQRQRPGIRRGRRHAVSRPPLLALSRTPCWVTEANQSIQPSYPWLPLNPGTWSPTSTKQPAEPFTSTTSPPRQSPFWRDRLTAGALSTAWMACWRWRALRSCRGSAWTAAAVSGQPHSCQRSIGHRENTLVLQASWFDRCARVFLVAWHYPDYMIKCCTGGTNTLLSICLLGGKHGSNHSFFPCKLQACGPRTATIPTPPSAAWTWRRALWRRSSPPRW